MFSFARLKREIETSGDVSNAVLHGIRVTLLSVLFLALQAMSAYAGSALKVDELIATWQAEWQSAASFDLGLLNESDPNLQEQVITRLAALARAGLTPGNDPLDAAFALSALSRVLDGRALDTALLRALDSPSPEVREEAARALSLAWERRRVACPDRRPQPEHCPHVGVFYRDDAVTTIIAQVQTALQSAFRWPLLQNLSVMRSVGAVLGSVETDSHELASTLVEYLLTDPEPRVQEALGEALHAYILATPQGVRETLLGALQRGLASKPHDLNARLVYAVRPVGTRETQAALDWIDVLDRLESDAALPALGHFIGSPTFSVAWNAGAAAAWIAGNDNVIPAWLEALGSRHPVVREAAATGLSAVAKGVSPAVAAQVGDLEPHREEVAEALLRLLDGDSRHEVGIALDGLLALQQSGVVLPVEPFIALAKDPRASEELRAAATRIALAVNPSAGDAIPDSARLQTLHRLVPLYKSGTEGYHTFRIPAVLVTPSGTVLAFAEGRRFSASDTGDIDLVLKRSTDGGVTWGPLQVIWDSGPHTSGNPVPVVDEATGRIWLFMTHNLGHDTEAEIAAGTSEGIRTIWLTYSDDDGLTWAEPVNMFEHVQDPHTRGDGTGPGIGIQLRHGPNRGRLVIPAQRRIIYSDDHGATWRQGGQLSDTNESQVVELSDGRLLRNDRPATWAPGNAVPSRRALSISNDQGATWGAIRYPNELVTPYVQGSIIRLVPADAEGPLAQILLFANPDHETDRVNMTVWVSLDDGATWPIKRSIYSGPSAYSSLVVLPNGTIGLLFEGGTDRPYENLLWTTFSLEWLLPPEVVESLEAHRT